MSSIGCIPCFFFIFILVSQITAEATDLIPDEMHQDMRIAERVFMMIVVWAYINKLERELCALIQVQCHWTVNTNPTAKNHGERILLPKSFHDTIKHFPKLDITGYFELVLIVLAACSCPSHSRHHRTLPQTEHHRFCLN
jgi:hypothetical protein